MGRVRLPIDAIDWLLVAAIVGLTAFLVAELSGPAVAAWRNRPRAERKCVSTTSPRSVKARTPGKWGLVICSICRGATTRGSSGRWWFSYTVRGSGANLEDVRRWGLPRAVEKANFGSQTPDRFILLSPQCPSQSSWEPKMILQLIDHVCDTFAVDRERVYLTGFSMGGSGAWNTACYDPQRFAAVVPVSGGGDVSKADRLKELPICAFHGEKDETVPLTASQAMVDAVRKCGGHVEFTVYPEHGHDIGDIVWQEPKLFEWLLAQRRGQPSVSPLAKKSP